MPGWGLSMMVSTLLCLGGVVSRTRDTALADRTMAQVRACSRAACALLICTDGWVAYPKSICRAFRDKVKETAGRGRCCLHVWSDLCIATVIKRAEKKRVVEVTRKLTRGTGRTSRTSLESITRRKRTQYGVYRAVGRSDARMSSCTHNFCLAHHELSKAQHQGYGCTPAMAAGGDRSCVEHSRGADIQDRSCTLDQAQATTRTPSQTRLSMFTT